MNKRQTSALVSWQQIIGATGYEIFWGKASGNYTNTANAGRTLSYRVPGLTRGTTYYFRAKAYDAMGESPYSNQVAFTP